MARTFGKTPRGGNYSSRPAQPATPKIVIKLKGQMHPGEMAVTLQQAAEELERRGVRFADKVSVYITPTDAEGVPQWVKNPDGSICEELTITPYCFVDRELKM